MLVVASGAWENADSKYVCVLPRSWGSRLSGQPRSYLSGSGGWRLLWAYPSLMSVLLEDVYSEAGMSAPLAQVVCDAYANLTQLTLDSTRMPRTSIGSLSTLHACKKLPFLVCMRSPSPL